MNAILAGLLARGRTLLLLLLFLVTTGGAAYVTVPKEAAPDIDIPIFFVVVLYPGISSEDAERLLVEPLERELGQLEGLDEMTSYAAEGFGTIQLEFVPGFDNDLAMLDVQRAVDLVEPELPEGAETPEVNEVNLDLFPILSIVLSGPLEERTLLQLSREFRDRLEGIDGVLEVDIVGEREEVMELLLDPMVMETYQISFQELSAAIERNNQLVPAGAVQAGAGRIGVIVPGTIEDMNDVLQIAVRVEEGTVITVGDVADVRERFVDPDSLTRIDGEPALTLDVRPSTGANVLDTVARVLEALEQAQDEWPDTLRVTLLQNQAEGIDDLLGDLESTVIVAVILVALTIVAALGVRAALLVAVAVPGAFLTGILAISVMGFTLNIVVLFALILSVGMLVDGAIVVVELADRYMSEGMDRREAFLRAAQRMSWPVVSFTVTTTAVFVPMLFWPGMIGEFMVYLPATVIVTLTASMFMALVFIPALGQIFGARTRGDNTEMVRLRAAETGDFAGAGRVVSRYVKLLRRLCQRPGWTLFGTLMLTVALYFLYAVFGRGVEFFPEIEPESLQVQVHARGDLSVWEADALVRQVEDRLMGIEGVEAVNARTIAEAQIRMQQNLAADTIGVIRLELENWRWRPPAGEITAVVRERTADLPGLNIQVRDDDQGPTAGRPIVVELGGQERSRLLEAVQVVHNVMAELGGFVDVQDDRPMPGIELRLSVDREQAARYGADVTMLGDAVQMLTEGAVLGVYHPEYTDEEIDIRMRYPLERRNIEELTRLRVPTAGGMVPISNFVTITPAPSTGLINRIDGRPAYQVEADAAPGYLVNERITTLGEALAAAELPEGVEVALRGQAEDQAEAGGFLVLAFFASVFLMFLVLVTQFNSLLQAVLVLSAIVFSTAGVLLGLLVRGEPFNVVMSGVGILALGGIVVNNNIVLIDTYNQIRREGVDRLEAALRTGAQRLRPVMLTAVTAVLALAPMVIGVTIDFLEPDIYFGAPATQFWIVLATAIVGGVFVATPLTLLMTPAMLVWMDRRDDRTA